jgi:hypothetical protein
MNYFFIRIISDISTCLAASTILSKSELLQNWKSQIVISNSINMGLKNKPYAFTELGIAMLSSVINSKTAIQVNIGIMRNSPFGVESCQQRT